MKNGNRLSSTAVLAAGALLMAGNLATAQVLFTESFSYPDGGLPGNGGWVGGDSTLHLVTGGALHLPFAIGTGVDGPDRAITIPLDAAPCEDGTITVKFKVWAATGANGGNGWGMQMYSDKGGGPPPTYELARWYGFPSAATPRVANSVPLAAVTISTNPGAPDELKVVINTRTNVTEFFRNGTSLGTISHGANNLANGDRWALTGNKLARIDITHWNRDDSTDPFKGDLYFDDLQVIGCDGSCTARLTPMDGLAAFTKLGVNPPVPDFFDLTLANTGLTLLGYTVQKVDVLGAPLASWLSLDKTAGSLATGATDTVKATLNAAALSGGEHVGVLKFADDCSPTPRTYSRAVKLFVADTDCFAESFPYADGVLVGQPGWVGASTTTNGQPGEAGEEISLVNGVVKVSGVASGGGAGGALHAVDPSCQVCGTGSSLISVQFKAKGGAGANNLWWVRARDAAGVDMAAWNSDGLHVRGRIVDTVTDTVALKTDAFDTVEARINVSTTSVIQGIPPGQVKFFLNGAPMGTTNNPMALAPGAGTAVAQLRIERAQSGGAGSIIYLDDFHVRCAEVCSAPAFDVRDLTGATAGDGHVTAQDLVAFESCATGPGVFGALSFECKCMDVSGDGDVDQVDFAAFQLCYTGPTETTVLGCDGK